MAIRQELAELLSESFDVNAPEYTSVAASALEQSLPVQSERVDGAPAVDGERLADLLRAAAAKRDAKARELALKDETVDRALYDARTTYLRLRERADELLRQHERTTNELVAHKATLERSEHDDASGVPTLKEALKVLTKRQSELESAADWFAVAAHAESLCFATLAALGEQRLDNAFGCYVALVRFIAWAQSRADTLSLTAHLVLMAASVWDAMVESLSKRLADALEAIGWPQEIKQPLDWASNPNAAVFRRAFSDMLRLEKLGEEHSLGSDDERFAAHEKKVNKGWRPPGAARPLLAFSPLVRPLVLRFRWHFDGSRATNRLDKPEYPLSHVLNVLSTHERFFEEDVQELLDENGYMAVEAIDEFTTLLLGPLATRIERTMPQLVELPSILAHTIYQTLEFDNALAGRVYVPRGAERWYGLSEVILGRPEWFNRWLNAEKDFFDGKYYAAISASDAWQIVPEEDYDATEAQTSVRPTNAALSVADLAEQITSRYQPLPVQHQFPFLLAMHLPLLSSYAQRISAALDAFETMSLGSLLPGALADGVGSRAGSGGLAGIVRLLRASVSARWMRERCDDWTEDPFFLTLFESLANASPVDLGQHEAFARTLAARDDHDVFGPVSNTFQHLSERAENLVVKLTVREVQTELRPYIAKRWDSETMRGAPEQPELSPELVAPLTVLSAILRAVVESLPAALASRLYRRVIQVMTQQLWDRVLAHRVWSARGGAQLRHDLQYGFLHAAREARVPSRALMRPWSKLLAGAAVLALPTAASGAPEATSFESTTRATSEATDQELEKVLVDVGESAGVDLKGHLTRADLSTLLKKRHDYWK